jgi:23S rRNA (uracil1939-C5)-methyltransferase
MENRFMADQHRGNGRTAPQPKPQPQQTEKANGLPVQPGLAYAADVVGLTHEGKGVARVDGFTLFVPGALPGEKIVVRAEEVKKQYGEGSLVRILEPSPDRVTPLCRVHENCGGAQLSHMRYEAQLKAKRQMVIDSLQRIGRLDHVRVHPVIGMNNPVRYRNKIHAPFAQKNGHLVTGFYAPGTQDIVESDHFPLGHSRIEKAINTVRRIADEFGLSAWNPQTRRGLLRHAVVRCSFATGDLMVVLVATGDRLPRQDELVGLLRAEIDGLASLCLNVNTGPSGEIMGDRTVVLWGADTIRDKIGDIEFVISPRSFFQVNPVQTAKLYNKALEYAGLTGEETVIDAYCGIGTISLFLARHARRVYGVEIVPDAVEDARLNARINRIRNVAFETGKAEAVLPRWRKQGIRADVIVVDPPRKGCDRRLLESIIAMGPKRVVYVSCNPATLARDLRILEDGGFRALEAQPVDMFPQTAHVECVVLITRL